MSVVSILRPIVPSFVVAIGWNAIGYAMSAPYQTEKFFDGFGTSTFALCAFYSLGQNLYANGVRSLHPRQIILVGTISLWSFRLFEHLTSRVHVMKGDRRFDKIKTNPVRFGAVFTIQALWATIVGMPVYVALAARGMPPLGVRDFVGLGLWTFGFVWEAIADRQKLEWQKARLDKRFADFIDEGLWKYSRFPNYFGEITLWAGTYLIGISAFKKAPIGVPLALLASPVFITFLLARVSGIPQQEKQASERFKDNKDYQHYRANTSVLIPWFPRKKSD